MTDTSDAAAPTYRISPADHLNIQNVFEHLWEARELLGCEDRTGPDGARQNGAAPTKPPIDVAGAAFELSQAIEILSYTESSYSDDAEGLVEADRIRAEEDETMAADEARYDAEDARRKAAGEPSQDEEAQQRLAENGRA